MSNLREPAAPAVIAGSFADYRLIKSRSVLQLVIEIPVEAQAGAFDALGYPMPGIEIPVAVARLNPASHRDDGERPLSVIELAQQGVIHSITSSRPTGQLDVTRDDMDSSVLDGGAKGTQQPGCGTEEYRKYTDRGRAEATTAGLTAKARYAARLPEQKAVTRAAILCGEPGFRTWLAGEDITAAQAAEVLRERCGVESRGEFADNPEALARFEKLEADYRFLKRIPEQRG